MEELDKKELHHLAMNIVGNHLEENGYEFLGVNSELKKNPQFVALKDEKLHFIVVRAITYPNDPKEYDDKIIKEVYDHALNFKARIFYAGVGLGNPKDPNLPVYKDQDYVVNYVGLQEVKL